VWKNPILTLGSVLICLFRESFTIHGLWPSARTEQLYANFDLDNIDNKVLLDDMENYWPPQSNDDKEADWLWSHEYDKHGKDFSNILQVYLPHEYERASAEQFQETYFQTVINYYKTFNVRKLDISRASPKPQRNDEGDLLVSKDQLSSIIGVPSENFIVSCSGKKGKNYLTEIKICFRVDENIDFSLENCLKIKSNG
jgi:ribonuclease I